MATPHRSSAASFAAAGALLLGAAAPALGQSEAERLSVHGYLTQGAGLSSDHPIIGLPTTATTDYRAAAVQVRYALTEQDNFVLQFNHRRASANPLVNAGEEVQLGWAFYQRRVGNGAVRIGRTPAALGLYNETRFVGTIIPLYRAPVSVYDESFEALDGVMVSQAFDLAPRWRLDATAYGGGFNLGQVVRTPAATQVGSQRSDRMYGGQLWVETPLSGVRLGGSAVRFKPNNHVLPGGGEVKLPWMSVWQATVEATGAPGALRAEYRDVDYGAYSRFSYYAQGVANLTEQLALVGQAEFMALDDAATPAVEERAQGHRDLGLGVRYALTPGVVFKLEGHRVKGYMLWDEYTDMTQPRKTTTYAIGSVSLSF